MKEAVASVLVSAEGTPTILQCLPPSSFCGIFLNNSFLCHAHLILSTIITLKCAQCELEAARTSCLGSSGASFLAKPWCLLRKTQPCHYSRPRN